MRALLIFLCLACPAAAQTPILLALRAQQWEAARALASAQDDPLATTLVDFIRLLNPGQARAGALAAFMAAHPDWPDRPALERRYGEALADEPAMKLVGQLCRQHVPVWAPALAQCAQGAALEGDKISAARWARAAWVSGLATPEQEADFLARWPGVASPADQQTRFDMLERADPASARRQIGRMGAEAAALATARLAFRTGDAEAMATLAAVPASLRASPDLLLAEARYLRRSHADEAALALWRAALPQAEAATPQAGRAAFWAERDALARDLLADGRAADAALLADDANLAPDQAVDSVFLVGWITLQRLHDPARAVAKFTALADMSHSAITQARAYYWLGRASGGAARQAAYMRASGWPLTFYGQLAARALGLDGPALATRIAAQQDPAVPEGEAAAFARSEPARAASILAAWEDERRGADFLSAAIQKPASLGTRVAAARLALRLGLPDVAVAAARLAGRDGFVLAQEGWPKPFVPPSAAVRPALVLGVMRQESSFDPKAASSAGAHGLMQLMPATAGQLARALSAPAGPLTDPDVNMRLGSAYLGDLLAQFPACEACAIAAYNAGPHRVHGWIAASGTPAPGEATIDWIEGLPFGETRNYVERVMENTVVYGG